MKLKKIISTSLLIVMAMQHTTTFANQLQFKDIDGHWAQGYIGGYEDNTFKPDKPITRSEFITLTNKAFGFTNHAEINFADVTKEDWFYDDICIAISSGYVGGYSDNTFRPNEKITREEASAIITTIKNNKDTNYDKINIYSDNQKIGSWAKSSVEGMLEAGYMGGYSDYTFKPQNSITRAEAITTIARVQNGEKVTLPSPPTKPTLPPVPTQIMLDVPVINQHKSGLALGCEAMATLMALEYKAGKDFDNYTFGINMPKDTTQVKTRNGYSGITQWGDPEVGFVGDITGRKMGCTVYPKPLVNYVNNLGYNAEDLSGSGFDSLLEEVKKGNPVVAWVSLNMNTPNDWTYWKTAQGKSIRVTFSAHSVTISGVDDKYVYYNDSWTGAKNKKISKIQFEKVYNWRGKRALVIR